MKAMDRITEFIVSIICMAVVVICVAVLMAAFDAPLALRLVPSALIGGVWGFLAARRESRRRIEDLCELIRNIDKNLRRPA